MKKIDKLFFKTKIFSKGRCNHCSLGFFQPFPSSPAFFFAVQLPPGHLFPHPPIPLLLYSFLAFFYHSVAVWCSISSSFDCLKLHCKNSTYVLQIWFEVWDFSEAPLSFSIKNSKYFKDMLLSSCSIFSLMTGQQDFPSRLESVGS